MRRIRLIILTVLLACAINVVKATTAYPGLIEFKQPDGQIVNIYIHGDEFLHWALTEDGYTLLYDEEGYLAYAEKDKSTGLLVPSKMRPSALPPDGVRRAPERKFLDNIGKGLWFADEQVEMARQALDAFNSNLPSRQGMGTVSNNGIATSGRRYMPHRATANANAVVGEKRMLLILVEFSDVAFKHTREDFDKLMNQLNYTEGGQYGSVRDFYRENSFGKLDMITDVVGVYRLSNTRAFYGGNSNYGSDNNPWAMASEAVTMADADVDYADYDNDGDGVVDGVHIIYAGAGEEAGGGADCIWAHSSYINITLDDKIVSHYSCSPEIRGSSGSNMTYIGVICHEIGHVLGCMDFYDTNYNIGGQYQGTGMWDLMGSGNWNGDGACPAHFNPYIKIYDYGWAEVIDGNKAASMSIAAMSENGFVRIDTKTPGEFFLLEYRTKYGFDLYLPGYGLMVYHAAANLADGLATNTANTTHKQMFYPVCANTTYEFPTSETYSYGVVNNSSTPFPGTNEVTELTDYTVPSMKSWAKVNTDYPITSIKEHAADAYITFDVAGGDYGGAYGLKVADSDLTSISLEWENRFNAPVLLVYSQTVATASPLAGSTYAPGDIIADCGEVLYYGADLSYKHTGLDEATDYYYYLYTQRDDGSWTHPRILKTCTQLGVIRKFPFIKDFEDQVLGDMWKQEHILSDRMKWEIIDFYDTGEMKLEANFSDFPTSKESTRLILPTIDFTGKACATLSFEYSNCMSNLALAYRTSPSDTWHKIEDLESMYDGSDIDKAKDYVTNIIRTKYVKLPNLTSTYEVAFVPTYYGSDIYGPIETVILDNLRIDADYDNITSTGYALKIGNTYAVVELNVFEGLKKIAKKGVEWSVDQDDWNEVESDANVAELTGLTPGLDVYYRAYSVDTDGNKYYGEVKAFQTLTLTNGSGTEQDPFIISSAADWDYFRYSIEGGNDLTNLYFALGASFTLQSNIIINGTFNGTLDGRGFTITPAGGSFKSLIFTIGKHGSVKRLNIKANTLVSGSFQSAGLCSYNNGHIADCSVTIDNLALTLGRTFGGLVAFNKGWITDCTSNINVKATMVWIGGICLYNYYTVSNCESYGEMFGNNNSWIGGITCSNRDCVIDGKNIGGLISNCRNYATIGNYREDDNTWYVLAAGICPFAHGNIERCANYGNINIVYGNSKIDIIGAGIAASFEKGTISDCVNYADISLDNSFTMNNLYVGGIAGDAYLSRLTNSVNLGDILISGDDDYSKFGAVVGQNNQSEVDNCWYAIDFHDNYAEKSDASNIVAKLNREIGADGYWALNDNGDPALRQSLLDMRFTAAVITDFGPDYINVDAFAAGDNLSDCALQWRKRGESSWHSTYGKIGDVATYSITGLAPKTLYELRICAKAKSGESICSDVNLFATMFDNSGLVGDEFIVNDYNELLAFARLVAHGETFGGQRVLLANDIDMRGSQGQLWEPVRSEYGENYFQGEFDGAGHVLYDMKIYTKKPYAGLFALTSGCIHDLTIRQGDITCLSAPAVGGYSAGVGGILGACISYGGSNYTYLVERCGFEGVIRGGNNIGGIIGEVSSADPMSDCYANALIYNTVNTKNTGGLIGKGNALNSYFVGEMYREYGNWRELPAIGNLYNDDYPHVNCYYDAVCHLSETHSIVSKTDGDMKSAVFLECLTPDIWTFADGYNDGYPIFAASNTTRISTDRAECDDDGYVSLTGISCDGAKGTPVDRGFQYFTSNATQLDLREVSTDDSGVIFKVTLDNYAIPTIGIEYRAFATFADGDSLFGQWKQFVPDVVLPRINVFKVEYRDETAMLLYAIDPGTESLNECYAVTLTANDARTQNVVDPTKTRCLIDMPTGDDVPYRTWIMCTTDQGKTFCSDTIYWGQAIMPEASIVSGSTVYIGTEVMLTTASSDGVIYYTTDGSDPCVESASRIKYSRPIVINADTKILAVTLVELNGEISEVAEYVYTLKRVEIDLSLAKGWNWVSHSLALPVAPADLTTDANVTRILSQTQELVRDPVFGLIGALNWLNAEECYKINTDDDAACNHLSGIACNPASPIAMTAGWNWLGCPIEQTMAIGDALADTETETLDVIVGREGFAQYDGVKWTGTLGVLSPGLGYMYQSISAKDVVYSLAPAAGGAPIESVDNYADDAATMIDVYKYPLVMPLIAVLRSADGRVLDNTDYRVYAFCADECRGVGRVIDGLVMMNVYGDLNDRITLRVTDHTGDVVYANDADLSLAETVVGSVKAPYQVTLNWQSGIGAVGADGRISVAVSDGYLIIEGIASADIDLVEIFDSHGTMFMHETQVSPLGIKVERLLPGVYIVIVRSDQAYTYHKVAIN